MVKFLEDSDIVALYYPAFQGLIAYRILGRRNRNFEAWTYGPVQQSFTDSGGTVHEEGAIPKTFTTPTYQIGNYLVPSGSLMSQDITYHLDSASLYHFSIDFRNIFLRNYLEIPKGNPQAVAYGQALPGSGNYDLGFRVGEIEIYAPPKSITGWVTWNSSNRDLRTNVLMRLAIYDVLLISNPTMLYQIAAKKGEGARARKFTVGGTQWNKNLDPFGVYGMTQPISMIELLNSKGDPVLAQKAVNKYWNKQAGATNGVVFET